MYQFFRFIYFRNSRKKIFFLTFYIYSWKFVISILFWNFSFDFQFFYQDIFHYMLVLFIFPLFNFLFSIFKIFFIFLIYFLSIFNFIFFFFSLILSLLLKISI